jgi:hypothetical protein
VQDDDDPRAGLACHESSGSNERPFRCGYDPVFFCVGLVADIECVLKQDRFLERTSRRAPGTVELTLG